MRNLKGILSCGIKFHMRGFLCILDDEKCNVQKYIERVKNQRVSYFLEKCVSNNWKRFKKIMVGNLFEER